jgi:signal transduction histidine kinase
VTFTQAAMPNNAPAAGRSLAHDLNNFLSIILGHAIDIEAVSDPAGEIHDSAAAIRKAAERAAALVASLNDAPSLEPVNIHDLVEEVILLLSPASSSIAFARLLRANNAVIQGNPTQLLQALLNLAINAREAMPSGGTLTFETRDTHAGRLEIRVTDSGPGIRPELRHLVFEPDFTTKPPGPHSGLGLSIVRRIVESHKGAIAIEDTPSGAAFLLTL